jgi:hypothetical protein
MTAKKCFTYDTTRRIYMAHASRQPYSKSRTDQLGSHPAAAVSALARGCPAIGPELLRLPAPGLSLRQAGTATQAPSPGRRCQSVLHRQAFAPTRRATPRLRRFDRIDLKLKRDRQPSYLGGAAPRGRSWRTRPPVSLEPFISNIALTDCCRTSWFRPTNCSCRTGAGRLLQARSPQAGRRW